MIRSKLMLCADTIVRDAQTNNISVFNIIEELRPERLPFLIARFSVLVVLDRDDDDPLEIVCPLRITIGGEAIVEQALNVNFQGKKRNRSIVVIGGLPVPRQGALETSFWYNGEMLNQYVITVHEPRQPTVETSQA